MAERGEQAFNTQDVNALNSHARLLARAAEGATDVALAFEFNTSLPTVRKWRQLPLGYQPPPRGARKKALQAAP